MEYKTKQRLVTAESVFDILPLEAKYLYKTLGNKIIWTSKKPTFYKTWIGNADSMSGDLGIISIKEFEGLNYVNCLYEKGVGLTNKNIEAELEYLYENINALEQEIKDLKRENENLKLQISLEKEHKNPWIYPQQPHITYFNNKE